MSHHAESVQMELVQGKCEDIYYCNPEITKKQCIPVKQTTKYVQAFNTLGAGTNVFLIPPNYGLQGVCLSMQLGTAASGTAAGLALPRGWGYALIKQISYRVGGSTQYFITGAQMLQHALKRMTNQTAKDDLLTLGGALITEAGFQTALNYAYVFLDLPFTKATAEGLPSPLPSDILGSQVQITVELNSISSIMSVNGGGSIPATLTSLATGSFQVQQLLMASRDDSLATRENMATHQYVYPCEFVQQEQVVSLQNTASVQTIVATGFRAGSVKSIEVWLTRDGWAAGTGSNVAAGAGTPLGTVALGKNPLKWLQPQYVQVTYAGDVYARFDAGISQLWNLINSKQSPYVDSADVSYSGSSYVVATGTQWGWVTCPFAQTCEDAQSGHFTLVEGLAVTNGVVNIAVQIPATYQAVDTGTNDWKLHLSYVYNSSIVFSQSSAEFVF